MSIPTARPIVQLICTGNDADGNPRQGWQVMSDTGFTLGWIQVPGSQDAHQALREGLRKMPDVLYAASPVDIGSISVTVAEYKRIRKGAME